MQIPLIHLIHHGHIFQQCDLVLFQFAGDAVDVDLRRGVAALHLFRVDLRLAEQSGNALLLRLVHCLEFDEKAGEHRANLTEIAGLDLGQRCVGKICDVLLSGRAVFQNLLRIFQVDLLGEGQNCLLFLRRECREIRAGLRRGLRLGNEILFLLDLRLRLRVQIRRQGKLGDVFVHSLFLLYL